MSNIRYLKKTFEIIISYMSMLSPRSKNIYVYGSWFGEKFSDNSKYLYIVANEQNCKRNIWITKNKDVSLELKKMGYEVYLSNSIKGIFFQLRAAIVFTTTKPYSDLNSILLGNAIQIDLWHGIPLKKIGYDVTPRKKIDFRMFPNRKEYVVTTSNTMKDIYIKAFDLPEEKVLVYGQPRNDVFFDSFLETKEELVTLNNLTKGRKIILYMPTHRNEGKTTLELRELLDFVKLNQFCRENNYLFVIKKHFFHKDEAPIDNLDSVVEITDVEMDVQSLLKYSEILITDYSSVYIDFLLVDRPIIYFNFDYENYLSFDREMYFDYQSVTPGPKVQNSEELLDELRNLIVLKKDNFKENRMSVSDIFYERSQIGPVSKNILSVVDRLR